MGHKKLDDLRKRTEAMLEYENTANEELEKCERQTLAPKETDGMAEPT